MTDQFSNPKEKKQGDNTILSQRRKVKGAGLLIHKGVLVILSENFFGKSFVIKKSVTKIGRMSACDITIKDPLISKEHCLLSYDEGGRFYIKDLDSKNSTYVNRKMIKRKALISYGDRILIGNTVLRFFLEEKFNER